LAEAFGNHSNNSPIIPLKNPNRMSITSSNETLQKQKRLPTFLNPNRLSVVGKDDQARYPQDSRRLSTIDSIYGTMNSRGHMGNRNSAIWESESNDHSLQTFEPYCSQLYYYYPHPFDENGQPIELVDYNGNVLSSDHLYYHGNAAYINPNQEETQNDHL
jgi:hypothetical protein